MYTVKVDVSSVNEILENHGIQDGGPAQAFFTSEVMRLSDPYVPFKAGVLKNSATMNQEKNAIIYNTPYARYHWYGKKMVDPKTGKACMVYTDPKTGNTVMYSRPGVAKVLTDIDMQYNGSPIRGPRWVERCWIDNKDKITKSVEKFIGGTK